IIGAAVVFLFSGLAISAVSRAAGRVVFEVREQFRTHPGIMDYTERPDYGAVVDICTKDSLRELATPGLLAVLAPVAVGFGLGFGPLASYLVGAIATGVRVAIALVAALIIVGAVVVSKRRSVVVGGAPSETPDNSLTTSAP